MATAADEEWVKANEKDRPIHISVMQDKQACPVCFKSKYVKLFATSGLQQHFRTMHRERFSDDIIKQGKQLTEKLHGDETKCFLEKFSSFRREKDSRLYSNFTVTLLLEAVPSQSLVIAAKSSREAVKLFGLVLMHYGLLNFLTGAPCRVAVASSTQSLDKDAWQKYNSWRARSRIYVECTTPKPRMQILSKYATMPLAEKEIFSKPYCAGGKDLTPLELLNEMFGYRSFRPGQEEAINIILMRQDVITVIPTGGGKTVIYTIPSLLGTGISIVISPIIMLMYDQVARLRELGANACYYNSLLTQDEREFILHNLTRSDCQYEFAFTSPEAILSPEFMACLQKLKENNRLQNFIIDEAHCVEVWGKDFRPDYQKLGELRKFDVPVVALTGTATKETISSIKSSLKMTNSTLVKLPCRRHNLRFEVVTKSDTNPKEQLVNMINERFGGLNGIIYCSRQNDTAELAFLLKQHHISATYYHGGMDPSDKVTNATLFLEGKVDAICATNAFGMGIDKKDVRFVIHYALPSSFEDMVQESGRAGRDGEEATCIILFKFSDRMNILRNISNVTSKDNQITMRKSLNEVTITLSNKTKCRQQSIAAYFEENPVCYVTIAKSLTTEKKTI